MTVRILFVAATGRSGSTLVDRMVGQLPGFVSAGEMKDIVRAGVGENRLCGCGQPFRSCPFWMRVGDTAFRGWNALDSAALAAELNPSYLGTVAQFVRGQRAAPHDVVRIRRLYEAISATAGGATIVDSSKAPNYAALLAGLPGFDVRILHLVRDSRGVAYSWSKRVRRPDVQDRQVEMLRMPPWEAAGRWVIKNATIELLTRRLPAVRLRYEELIASPRATLSHAVRSLGVSIDPAALDFIGEQSVRLGPAHTVMGNPMRMQAGEVELRLDDEWRHQFSPASRALVTASTWPFLLRYGYSLW